MATISAVFRLFLIKEFQRLKEDELRAKSLEWYLQRTLSKINYRIHTDAIRLNHDFNKIYMITLIILFEKNHDNQFNQKNQSSDKYGKHKRIAHTSATSAKRALVQLNAVAITQMKSPTDNRNLMNRLK